MGKMANSFLNRHLSEMMNQQLKDLSSYIGLQQQLSDDKLKQEEKEELKQKSQALLNNIADNKASLNVNLLSGVESFAKQVKEDWAQYTEPALNCTQFIHEYEKDIAKDPTKKLSDDAVITTKHVSTVCWRHHTGSFDSGYHYRPSIPSVGLERHSESPDSLC